MYFAVNSDEHCSQLRRTGYHQSSIAAKVGNLSAVRSRPSTCCKNHRHSSSDKCLYLFRCNANSCTDIIMGKYLFVRISFFRHLCRTYLTKTGTVAPTVSGKVKDER